MRKIRPAQAATRTEFALARRPPHANAAAGLPESEQKAPVPHKCSRRIAGIRTESAGPHANAAAGLPESEQKASDPEHAARGISKWFSWNGCEKEPVDPVYRSFEDTPFSVPLRKGRRKNGRKGQILSPLTHENDMRRRRLHGRTDCPRRSCDPKCQRAMFFTGVSSKVLIVQF